MNCDRTAKCECDPGVLCPGKMQRAYEACAAIPPRPSQQPDIISAKMFDALSATAEECGLSTNEAWGIVKYQLDNPKVLKAFVHHMTKGDK